MRYYRKLAGNGELPPMFTVDACIRRELQQRYTRYSLGEELSLSNIKDILKEDMKVEARLAQKNQEVIHEDERLSVQEIYNRQMQYYPPEVRKLDKVAGYTETLLNQPVAVPESIRTNAAQAQYIHMDVRLIRWDAGQLLEVLEKEVRLTEAEMRARHTEEQAKQKEDQRIPFQKDKPFLEKRMRTEKAREKQAGIKTKLAGLKAGFSLDDVQKITNLPIESIQNVGLAELGGVKIARGLVNLDQGPLLKSLSTVGSGKASAGPLQDGRYTVYAEVSNLQIISSAKEVAADPATKDAPENELGATLGREWMNHMINSEVERGQLRVIQIQKENVQ